MVWKLGFLLLIGREGYEAAETILYFVNEDYFNIASRALCGAHASFLLGYSLLFREFALPRRQKSSAAAQPPLAISSRFSSAQLPLAIFLGSLLLAMLFVYGPGAIDSALSGRHAGSSFSFGGGAFGTVMRGLMNALRIVLPAMIGFYVTKSLRKPAWTAWLISSPVLVLIFFGGTRFPLLFAGLGLWLATVREHRLSKSLLLRTALVGVLLVGSGLFMAANRASGYSDLSLKNVEDYVQNRGVMHTEGTVLYMAYLAEYTERHGHQWGRSTSTLFIFWIPRALWPNKPTFLGYWFPREYLGLRSDSHSVSFGYAGDAFLDFGVYGATIFWLILGFFFAFIERKTALILVENNNAHILYAGLLYAGVFFAVRSPNTTVFMVLGGILWIIVFTRILAASNARLVRAHTSARALSHRLASPAPKSF